MLENPSVSEIAGYVKNFAEEKFPEIGWDIKALNERALGIYVTDAPYPINLEETHEGDFVDSVASHVYEFAMRFNDYDESRGPGFYGFKFAIDFDVKLNPKN